MKKRTSTKRKGLSALLAMVMLIAGIFPNYALAAEPVMHDAAEGIDLYSTLSDEDLRIKAEVATCVAELFVRDMINTGTTDWDETTKPVNTVTMYDETGESPTAFSVELTDGYVVISAYIDVPDIILEWDDNTTPYYYESAAIPALQDANHETKIIYLGALDYYIDNGSNEVETVFGDKVERSSLTYSLDKVRSGKYISNEVYSFLSDTNPNIYAEYGIQVADEVAKNHKGQIIDDVIEYAKIVYGDGTWTCHDYANNWEKWVGNCTYNMVEHASGSGHDDTACCPIAITNLIMMHKQKKYNWTYTVDDYMNVFNNVKNMKFFLFFPYYTPGTGVTSLAAKDYVKAAFNKYGETSITIGNHGRFTDSNECTEISLTPVIETCKESNRLMLMYLYEGENHGYGTHYVVGYAYNRIQNPKQTALRTFVKIRDGDSTGPRYLDIYNFGDVSMYYDIILS